MNPHSVSLLADIGLSIIFAALCSHLARALRQPLILGYVLGGALLGANVGFELVTNVESIELISEIGLILLLFIIGLEINLRELIGMGKSMFTLGVVQFLGCVLTAMAVFKWLGASIIQGRFDLLYVGVALALSSTLIVVKLLHDKFETHTLSGRLTIGVLVLQDLWAILFMAFQPNLQNPQVLGIAKSLGWGAVLVFLSFLTSRHLLSKLFRAGAKSPELVLLTAIAWCFSICGLAEEVGLSKEMGALIAGISIAAFPYGTDVIAKLSGVRDFFVTLFFVSLGLKIPQPSWALLNAALLSLGAVLAGRLLSIVPTVHFLKKGLRTGFVTALNLSQISEFSLVILSLGVSYGHVSQGLPNVILTSMLLASIVSTYLIQFNDALARKAVYVLSRTGFRHIREEKSGQADEKDGQRDIVLLGCFRAGMAFLDNVEAQAPQLKSRILVVDFNPALGETLQSRGFHWVYGDLANPETLQHLGIGKASVVVCSLSDTFLKGITNRRLLGHLKQLAPDADCVMTADDVGDAEILQKEGAAHVLVPGQLSGRKLFELLSGTYSEN